MTSLRQIRYFLAVAELGSFTQAAAQLFIAQPALSRQISLLEAELGFTLFIRAARGVSLTPAGALFRERTAAIGSALDEAVEDGRRLARGEAGVLRVLHSSSVPMAGTFLAALQALCAQAPAVHVDVDRLSSELQVVEIAAGRADVGLARMPVLRRDATVDFVTLGQEALAVALPVGHKLAARDTLTIAELATEAFVSALHRERGGLARRVTELCLARGFVPELAPVVTRKTSMLALVGAGFGIAVIPASLAALAPPNVSVRPLADADAVAETALLLPLAPSPLALRFAALCGA
jgi:DNA-binding transcriptional LysR family regulator